jgi:YDG domain
MIKNIKLHLLALAFSLMLTTPLVASAALITTDATINSATSTTVSPSASVAVGLTTVYDVDSWKGTLFAFATTTPAPASMGCYNHTDYIGTGTTTESFSVTAPATVGMYNLYVQANDSDTCIGTTSGNIFELTGALTVQATPQTITFDAIASTTKTYGDSAVTVYATSSSALPVTFSTTASSSVCTIAGDVVTFTGPGSCDVTANQAGDMTYAPAAPVTQTFTINPASLTLTTAGSIATKVYDAATTVSFSGAPIAINETLVGTDTVTVIGTYSTKNVGTSTVTLALSGVDAFKYTLAATTMDGNITARPLAITATGTAKTYDGNTSATVTYGNDKVGTDDVTVSGTATFTDKHVGTAKNIDITNISLTGTDALNYTYSTTASTTANITAKSLALIATTETRVYNGTASSSVPVIVTLETGDTYTAYQEFDNKNVGTPKTITPFITIVDGNGGNNYAISTTTAMGSITAKDVTVANLSIESKVYDKTTVATKSASTTPTITGVVVGDESYIALDFTATVFTFNNEHVGVAKTVTATGTILTGSEAANYNLLAVTATGDITARPISVAATTSTTKVYDTTTASLGIPTVTLGSIVLGDTASFTQTYDTKDAGTGKIVTAQGTVLDGNNGDNYAITFVTQTNGVITPAPLNVTALVSSKVYDGNVYASTTLFDTRISTSTDTFIITFASSSYNNKHVGTGKIVTISGLAKTGVGADNYAFATTTITTTGDITAKTLTATSHVPNKVYDTTTTATVSYTDDRVSGDAIGLTGTAAFNDAFAGVGKLVLLSPVSLFGPDAGNYALSAQTTTTADITPASTALSFTADNKVYDATTTATILTRTLSGALGGDVVTVSGGVAVFANKNVGTGKIVTATGFTLGGAQGANYVIVAISSTTANITTYALTPTVIAYDKTYDATDVASTTITVNSISGDNVTITGSSTGTFDNKNVGTNKLVTVHGLTLSGTDASNYTLTTTTETDTADITTLSTTASIVALDKTYDATDVATATCSVIAISGDDLSCVIGSTTTFDNKLVGTGKTVTATGITLDGVDMNNYTLTSSTATGTANVSKATISVLFTVSDKVYDGNASSTILASTTVGVISPDDVTVSDGIAMFDTVTVGTNKVVTLLGSVLSGVDAGNYNIATSTTTANITPVPVVTGGSSQSFGGSNGGGSSGSSFVSATTTPALTTGTPISSVVGTSTLACVPVFTKYMRYGRVNDKAEVIKLQVFLNTYTGTKLPLTGFFGTMTRSAILKFQATYMKMKKPTGLVLLNTITMMNAMSCAVENK